MPSAQHVDPDWPLRSPNVHRSRASVVRLGSLPESSEQDLRFVQDRIALYGKTTFLIAGMFLVVAATADLLRGVNRMQPFGRLSHLVGTLIALALWRIADSRRSFSPNILQALDVVATLGFCVCFESMGHHSIQPYGFYTAMLAVTHVSVSRAMIVPSVPSRTFWLGVASFIGFLVSRATLPMDVAPAQLIAARSRDLVEAMLWSTAGTSVATVASKVIYGLHEKAREALQLGQYTLEEKIGEGGMSKVYRAHHAMLRRPTAVKLLQGDGSERQLRRFEKEVRLTARLTHPNTISIYDYGRTPDGVFYYAMELLDGLTLEQLVERYGPQPAGRVIHLLRQVCGALGEAHAIGLIHRDIKPANIFLSRRGGVPDVVKVLDFGLVQELESDGELTQSNAESMVVGTPLYMSPEAIRSPEGTDARTDIYGLGGVAYCLVTGTPPFMARNVVELCAHHLHTSPEPPSRRHAVPDDLEQVILACLAKDPQDRPQSARALSEALDGCRDALTWRDSEAESWWTEVSGAELHPSTQRPIGGEHTIVCVDLQQRLAAIGRTPG